MDVPRALAAAVESAVRTPVRARSLEHWNGSWTVEPGRFQLAAGPSSAAQPVTTEVEVRG